MSHLTKSSEVHLAALTLSTSALLLLHLPTARVVLGRRPRRWVRGARLHQDAVRASLGWATVLTAEVAWKEQVSVQDNKTEGKTINQSQYSLVLQNAQLPHPGPESIWQPAHSPHLFIILIKTCLYYSRCRQHRSVIFNNFFIQAISFVQKHHITFALS